MAKDATQVAAAWAAGMANAGTKITAGVNAVTEAPGMKAAAQAAVWARNTAAAQNRYATNSAAVSLAAWKQATIGLGIPRIAAGASAAQPKMQAFLQWFLPAQQAVTDTVRAMPKGTIDQSIARMVAQIQGTHALKR